MRALLARNGFDVVRDQGTDALDAGLGDEIATRTRYFGHMRIVVADRRA